MLTDHQYLKLKGKQAIYSENGNRGLVMVHDVRIEDNDFLHVEVEAIENQSETSFFKGAKAGDRWKASFKEGHQHYAGWYLEPYK